MKKILALLLVLALPAVAAARDIDEGTVEITGTSQLNMNWSSSDSGGGDVDTYTLNVDAQYYIMKNVAVGGFFSYEDLDFEAGGDTTLWLIGPQATYNVSYDDKLSFFGTVGLVYADYEIGDTSGDGFGIRLGGGMKFFLTKNVALVGQLRYQRLDLDDSDIDEFNLSGGFSVLF